MKRFHKERERAPELLVEEGTLESCAELTESIPEFMEGVDDYPVNDPAFLTERLSDKEDVVILNAKEGQKVVGYLIGYRDVDDPESFYVWLAAMHKNYRRRGGRKKIQSVLLQRIDRTRYKRITGKTRRKREAMLHAYQTLGYRFVKIITMDHPSEDRIHVALDLEETDKKRVQESWEQFRAS